MPDDIYLFVNDELTEMAAQPYESEDDLQVLLEKHPQLLPGAQIDALSPRRWLLIRREMGVADEEDGAARWYLDHLFLDQDAVPTLVEVKRSDDSRARRLVVAQMLDYAANVAVAWKVEELRALFEHRCASDGVSPAEEWCACLDLPPEGYDDYWLQAKTNLQAGRLRLVFVSDKIAPELRRIVEFLNGQMDPAQVLAVELPQFVAEGVRALVPRVLGQTAEAERQKSAGGKQPMLDWDEASVLSAVRAQNGDDVARFCEEVCRHAEDLGYELSYGGGSIGSINLSIREGYRSAVALRLWASGALWAYWCNLAKLPAFAPEEPRLALLEILNQIPGTELPPNSIETAKSVAQLPALLSKDAQDTLYSALDFVARTASGSEL
jgi:hypothetical protein